MPRERNDHYLRFFRANTTGTSLDPHIDPDCVSWMCLLSRTMLGIIRELERVELSCCNNCINTREFPRRGNELKPCTTSTQEIRRIVAKWKQSKVRKRDCLATMSREKFLYRPLTLCRDRFVNITDISRGEGSKDPSPQRTGASR